MAGPGDENEIIDLHELCIEGNYSELKSLLETRKGIDVNKYKLFVYRPLPNKSNSDSNLIDNEDEYQSDEELTESGTMFDYRSPLFFAILHDRLACVKLLIEHGANTDKLR
jgi:ankyrin repeat protein